MSTKALVSRFEAEVSPSAPSQHEQAETQVEEHRLNIDPKEGQKQGNKGTGTGGRGEERPQWGSKEGSRGEKADQPRTQQTQQTGGPLGGSHVTQPKITEQDRERIISSLGATHEYSSDDELGLMDFENGRSKRRLSNSSNASTDHDRGAKKGKTLDDSLSSLVSPLSDEEGSDGSFIRVTKGNRRSHREGGAAGGHTGVRQVVSGKSPNSNAPAFEENIKEKEIGVGLGTKTVETVYILFNLVGNGIKHATATQFAKGFSSFIGGCISSHLHPKGVSFRIRSDQVKKAKAYTDPRVESRTPTISTTPPVIRKPAPNEQNRNKQQRQSRSYAILDLSFMEQIENIKNLFDIKKWGIADVVAMSDKRGQKTGKYKLTFSTQSPPTELPELGSGFLHPLEPYYMNYVRCNKCQKFGHLKRFCKSKTSVCPQCAGKHSYAQCKATRSNRKCANCGLLTHGAAYRGCSAYQQYMRKIDDSNIQIHNAWSLRMAKPSQTPRTVPDPWVGSSKIPTGLPVPQLTFTQRQLEEATAVARHETQKETLRVVADMLGSLGIMTSTGQTLTSETIRQRVEEMYPGTPTQGTSTGEPEQPEPEPCVIPDTQDTAIPDTQNTRVNSDVRNTRVTQQSPAGGSTQVAPRSRRPRHRAEEVSELPVPISPRTQRAVAYKPPQSIKMVRHSQKANGRKIVQSRLADTQKWVASTPKSGKIVKKANSAPAKAGRN